MVCPSDIWRVCAGECVDYSYPASIEESPFIIDIENQRVKYESISDNTYHRKSTSKRVH